MKTLYRLDFYGKSGNGYFEGIFDSLDSAKTKLSYFTETDKAPAENIAFNQITVFEVPGKIVSKMAAWGCGEIIKDIYFIK